MTRVLLTVAVAGLLVAGPAGAPRPPLSSLDWLRTVAVEVTETDSGAVITLFATTPADKQAIRDYVEELTAAAAPAVRDPVCGMTVDRAAAALAGLVATHGGRTYSFCNPSCRSSFLKQPARFAWPANQAKPMGAGGR
jgi:YHS domain-containing protein